LPRPVEYWQIQNIPNEQGAKDENKATETNRLDRNIECQQHVDRKTEENGESSGESVSDKLAPGFITWHICASHARMKHRLDHSPEIGARVYELGLRKYSAFFTIPPFTLRYAQQLLAWVTR
jgi:hypothetical protein